MSGHGEALSPLKQALFELRDLRARLEKAERVTTDPIAIIGVGLRLPGGLSTPGDFWDFLLRGGDAISEVPRDRWNADAFHEPGGDACGKIVTRFGGFLPSVGEFDARFFGITPREAASMDPQQRLLLESSWEALEHAGQAPDALIGSATGVFMGIGSCDYLGAELKFTPLENIDAYLASGGVPSVIAGRVSYVFGLNGPSLTVDTACSSSLTAVHLAVQSLRRGECTMALAGGANVLLLPELSITCSRAHMLAPDGRCKTFDRRADGYVRSEGCGVVVLKRLRDAVASGDRVLAVIRGTAINQDGRSSGLTVPNGGAQEAVIRDALRNAAVRPADVSYVEAHGTGTSLGDPIELRALGNVFRGGRERPLLVGSVKTNVGHLEAAAGITGLIKVALSLERGVIPPHLHLQEPTPHVNWHELALSVTTSAVPWSGAAGMRYAGVSSFGFSGTNAHVVLSEAPADERAAAATRPVHVLTLSAKSSHALEQAARRLADHLSADRHPLAEICYTANAGRAHLPERAAMIVGSSEEARVALTIIGAGRHADNIERATAPARAPEVAFLFAGQGVQAAGMGRQLFETQPAFRRALEECDDLLRPHLDTPLLSVLYPASGDASLIDDPRYAHPAIFAFEYALAAMWQAWGIQPAYVLGHSLGEDVAACVAGVFTLEDGLTMVARRARLMHDHTSPGSMAAVCADETDVANVIANTPNVVIASRNGPCATVISGPRDEMTVVTEAMRAAGMKVRPLKTGVACHSPQMDPILDAIEDLARQTPMQSPRLGVVSTITGRVATSAEIRDPRYWRRHVREIVRFTESLETLYRAGTRIFLEIGPSASLIAMGRRSLTAEDVSWLPSLDRAGEDWRRVAESVRTLYVKGVKVNWAAFDSDYAARKIALPSYPFQRECHWSDAVAPRHHVPPPWTPRGRRLRSPALTGRVFQSEISLSACPMLADHRVNGRIIAPGALFVEAALGADPVRPVLRDLSIQSPLEIPPDGARVLQLLLSPEDGSFSIESASEEDEADRPWVRHATGRLSPLTSASTPTVDVQAIRDRAGSTTTGEEIYARLEALGFEMGSRFRAIRLVEHRSGESLGTLDLPPDANQGQWSIHPALFDAAVQTALCAMPSRPDGAPYIFAGCGRVIQHGAVPSQVVSWFTADAVSPVDGETRSGRLIMCDERGQVLVDVDDVQFRPLRAAAPQQVEFADPRLHEIVWRPQPLATEDGGSTRLQFDTASIVGCVEREAREAVERHKLAEYGLALSEVESRATSHIVRALVQLGVPTTPGSRVSVEMCVARHGVLAKYRRLLTRFFTILDAEQFLAANGDEWVVRRQLAANAPPNGPIDLASAERVVTDRCGLELARVLRGDADPLALLFPGGSTADLEAIYQRSVPSQFANAIVSAAVAEIVRALPAGRTLRVLEVGGGTGGTTESVLRVLPAERTKYVFTDLSRVFLDRAAAKFSAATFVDYRVLDLDCDPDDQGFGGQRFDVVLGVNVVHATADLRKTLRRLKALLTPGGVLLLTEAIAPQRWLDVTFGLTDGWWRFEDADLRFDYPLLDRAAWLRLLASCGFADGHVAPGRNAAFPETHAVLVARTDVAADAKARQWLVVGADDDMSAAIAARLREHGPEVTFVRDASDVGAALGSTYPLEGCVNLTPLIAEAPDSACLTLLQLVQSLTQAGAAAPIWTVTRGVAIGAATGGDVTASTAWGLGRVIALEHPDLWGGLIDIGDAAIDRAAERVASELLRGNGEDQIAWAGDQRHVARLVKTGRVAVSPVTIDADATYLIAGGLGRLGLECARWLVSQGARHVTLVGRSALPPREQWDAQASNPAVAARIEAVRELEASGARLYIVAADVADRQSMTDLFARFGVTLPPLRGIAHAAHSAGTVRVAAMTPEELRAMLRPKVTGTMLLDELSRGLPLQFFVLFSSTTGLIGSIALGHYAAANTFLDAFARAHRSPDRPITAIAWGAWQDLQIASADVKRAMEASGLNLLPIADGIAAFARLLGASHPNPVFVDADWPTLRAAYESRRRRPLLAELGGSMGAAQRATVSAPLTGDVRRQLAGVRDADRDAVLAGLVIREAAHVLRVNEHDIDPTQGLFDLGMDSLMAVELRSRLERGLDLKLPSTLTFNYPSVQAIAAYLRRELAGDEAKGDGAAVATPLPSPVAPRRAVVTHDDLSESELADMLARTLAELP